MISPRWKKQIRDFTGSRGRSTLMLTAITAGIFAVTVILSTFVILTREMSRNYLDTNPAAATLVVGEVTEELLNAALDFPGVAEAEARRVVIARVVVGDNWLPMRLFVIDDFEQMRLNTFQPVSGAWPPAPGAMLIEQTAERVLEQTTGGSVTVKTPGGAPTKVQITGIVHDATLAPAWQDQTGYGYITRQTLAMLGEAPILDELRILLDGDPANITLIEDKARSLALLLGERGFTVDEIRIPPPLTHPHQTQMMGILFLFLAFAAMAFFLSTILVANIVAALLARQVREIGVMKAVGARTSQIVLLYLSMLFGVGLFSLMIGLPSGLFAAGKFADLIAELLNLVLYSYAVPIWTYVILITSGLLVPVLVALPVIAKASSISVRKAMFDTEATNVSVTQIRGLSLSLNMALRNMFRRRGRLYLSLALLAAGGGMFITALNTNNSWQTFVDRVYTDRSYDAEFILNEPTPKSQIAQAIAKLPDIEQVEMWGYSRTVFAQDGQIDISRTYPDGGHGSFTLLGIPPETTLIDFPLIEGRWLRTGDTEAIVLNQIAKALVADARIGDQITLSLDSHGENEVWELAGVVEEIGSGAAAYVTDRAFDEAAGTDGRAQMIRIATVLDDPIERAALIGVIDTALQQAGIGIKGAVPLTLLRTAMGEHVIVLVATLIMTAILLAIIGLLGLTSTMSMNVLERTREIGVMKVSGATPSVIVKIIVSEGVFIALMSWFLAILLSIPLTLQIGSIVGEMSFKTPLGLNVSWAAVFYWLCLVVVLSAFASLAPAWRAARMPVQKAITHD